MFEKATWKPTNWSFSIHRDNALPNAEQTESLVPNYLATPAKLLGRSRPASLPLLLGYPQEPDNKTLLLKIELSPLPPFSIAFLLLLVLFF